MSQNRPNTPFKTPLGHLWPREISRVEPVPANAESKFHLNFILFRRMLSGEAFGSRPLASSTSFFRGASGPTGCHRLFSRGPPARPAAAGFFPGGLQPGRLKPCHFHTCELSHVISEDKIYLQFHTIMQSHIIFTHVKPHH